MAANLIFITGGSSGIGRALAATCPFPDARLLDLSRRGGAPGSLHVKVDLACAAGWREAAAVFQRELDGFAGERAVLFHCAGTLDPIGFAGEVDPAAYTDQVLLNSAAPQVLGDSFLRAARSATAACHLIMVSSGAATTVYPGWSAYGAGKAAVDQWVRTAGDEQARRGGHCRVVAVAPGVVETAMQEQIRATPREQLPDLDRFIELHESGALRRPEDAARDLWHLLEAPLANGAVLDLRDAPIAGDGE